jgi:very-short-patch-repair endonuclease
MAKQPEGTAEKVARTIAEAAQAVAERFEEEFLDLARHCESPIEELLLASLFAGQHYHEFEVIFMGDLEPSDRHIRGETAYVYQQARVGPYRTDFLIHDCTMPLEIAAPRFMVVECDGHDFHERTKEQARRDKQRDRYFQSRGYKVLRFTGSEIFADPQAVADEVMGELARDDDWRNRDR